MASLLIRDLEDDVKRKLRIRAARNGRSMEAEAREILTTTVAATAPETGLGARIRQIFADVDPDTRNAYADIMDLIVAGRRDPEALRELDRRYPFDRDDVTGANDERA